MTAAAAASTFDGAPNLKTPFPDIFASLLTFIWTGGEDNPIVWAAIDATVSNDGARNNKLVIHYEGTTDAAQPASPSPRMDYYPSATLESSTVQLSQEPVDEDTSRVIHATPRDYVEQGVHLSPDQDKLNLSCQ